MENEVKSSFSKFILIFTFTLLFVNSNIVNAAKIKKSDPTQFRMAIISTEMKALLVSGSMGLLYGWLG